jgi:hypothetical protein
MSAKPRIPATLWHSSSGEGVSCDSIVDAENNKTDSVSAQNVSEQQQTHEQRIKTITKRITSI